MAMESYDASAVETCGSLLTELEANMKWSVTDGWTADTRKQWLQKVDTAVGNNQLDKLYDLARNLEGKMKYSEQKDEWKIWMRDYWIRAYSTESQCVDTTPTVTHFALGLKVLEFSLKWSEPDSWKGGKRDAWLKRVDSILSPVEGALFADDLLEQIDKCIGNKSFKEWEGTVSDSCSKLEELAVVLDQVNTNTGAAQAAGGGAAVAGGVVAILGILAAPFTAGLSLAATAAGGVTAAAGAVTGIGANLAKMGLDSKRMKEASEVMKETSKDMQILAECLGVYGELVTNFREFLETPKGKELMEQLEQDEDKDPMKKLKKKLEKKLKKKLKKIALKAGKKIAIKIATKVAARVGVLAGTSIVKGVSVGFATIAPGINVALGIFDIVQGAKQIQDGSELARQLRNFARELEKTKSTLAEQYRSFVE